MIKNFLLIPISPLGEQNMSRRYVAPHAFEWLASCSTSTNYVWSRNIGRGLFRLETAQMGSLIIAKGQSMNSLTGKMIPEP